MNEPECSCQDVDPIGNNRQMKPAHWAVTSTQMCSQTALSWQSCWFEDLSVSCRSESGISEWFDSVSELSEGAGWGIGNDNRRVTPSTRLQESWLASPWHSLAFWASRGVACYRRWWWISRCRQWWLEVPPCLEFFPAWLLASSRLEADINLKFLPSAFFGLHPHHLYCLMHRPRNAKWLSSQDESCIVLSTNRQWAHFCQYRYLLSIRWIALSDLQSIRWDLKCSKDLRYSHWPDYPSMPDVCDGWLPDRLGLVWGICH